MTLDKSSALIYNSEVIRFKLQVVDYQIEKINLSASLGLKQWRSLCISTSIELL
jgi:hypothetical protein